MHNHVIGPERRKGSRRRRKRALEPRRRGEPVVYPRQTEFPDGDHEEEQDEGAKRRGRRNVLGKRRSMIADDTRIYDRIVEAIDRRRPARRKMNERSDRYSRSSIDRAGANWIVPLLRDCFSIARRAAFDADSRFVSASYRDNNNHSAIPNS